MLLREAINIVENIQREPRIDAEARGEIAYVHDLYVPKELRGKGIGQKLYLNWETNLPSETKLVKLFAADYGDGLGNSDPFWERLGFEHQYYGETMSYEGEHTMWKGVKCHPTPEPVDWDAYED